MAFLGPRAPRPETAAGAVPAVPPLGPGALRPGTAAEADPAVAALRPRAPRFGTPSGAVPAVIPPASPRTPARTQPRPSFALGLLLVAMLAAFAPVQVQAQDPTPTITITWVETRPGSLVLIVDYNVPVSAFGATSLHLNRGTETWIAGFSGAFPPGHVITSVGIVDTYYRGHVNRIKVCSPLKKDGREVCSDWVDVLVGDIEQPGKVVAKAGPRKAHLSWTAPDPLENNKGETLSAPLQKYQLRQRAKSGNTWGAWTDWADTGTTPALATSYTATDLTPGTEYQFQVRGVTSRGPGVESRKSNATATTTPWDYPTVQAPQNLRATPDSEEVTLAWIPPPTPVYAGDPSYTFTMKYQYRLSTDGGTTWNPDWTDVTGSTGTTPIVWKATKLTADTEYTIQVRGHIGKDDGKPAELTTQTCRVGGQCLIVDVDGDGHHDHTPGTFVLERAASATFRLKYLKTSASPATLFLAPGAHVIATGTGLHTDGTTPVVTWAANAQDQWQTVTLSTERDWGSTVWGSEHEVEVLDAAGSSGPAQATIPVRLVGYPRMPDGLTAETERGGVRLTWDAGEEGEVDDYRVRVSDDGGASWDPDWVGVGTKPGYTVGGLSAGADYVFEVGAVNIRYRSIRYGSGPTARAQVTLPELPAAPASLTASSAGPSVALAWPDPEDQTITGWQYRHRFPGNADFGPWADVPDAGAGTTSHLVRGLRAATVYVFQVRAVNAAGGGGPSPEARATPVLPPVAFDVQAEVLDAAPGETPKVRVRWRVNGAPAGTIWQMRRTGSYAWLDWVDAGAPTVDGAGRLSAAPPRLSQSRQRHRGVLAGTGHQWRRPGCGLAGRVPALPGTERQREVRAGAGRGSPDVQPDQRPGGRGHPVPFPSRQRSLGRVDRRRPA